MRQTSLFGIFILATLFIAFASSSHAQFSLGTGFTYQGQLKDGGSPVTGSYDFEFKLFDDPTAGTQQGPTVTANELAVSGGLFSTVLDFGAQFSGQKRWLEIGVRPGADTDPDPYTLLTPRTELTASPNSLYASNSGMLDGKDSLDFLEKDGRAFVIVRTTDNAVTNGTNLQAAYTQAKALTPHGLPLFAENRAVVIVPPGRYDFGTGQLLMDAEFVDLVGLSTAPEDQYIFGLSNGLNTGVLRQTANNVRIENLRVHCTRFSGSLSNNSTDPAAYFPDSNKPQTILRNCRFEANDANARSMRVGIIYSGRHEFCIGGNNAFGGGGTANGVFINCVGGNNAFGAGVGGTANGTFINCTGDINAFGGGGGTASGNFIHCTGGNSAFGGGIGGTANGTFTNCTGSDLAFGGRGTTINGTFTRCTGGAMAFGGGTGGIAGGTFKDCTGGDNAFGGGDGTASGNFANCAGGLSAFGGGGGTAGGIFTNCTGASGAFGGGSGGLADGTFNDCTGITGAFGGDGGTASGMFTDCTGGDNAFGGGSGIGTASGTFTNCVGGDFSFGGTSMASGRFRHCTGGTFAFGGGGTASGSFANCIGGNNSFGGTGTAPNGKFFHCNGGSSSFTETGIPAPAQFFCTQNGVQYPFNN